MTAPVRTPSRDELREHLISSRIAGDVATSREDNLDHMLRLSERDPLYLLGLDPSGAWTMDEVLALMAKLCGVSADPDHTHGQDTIDPDRTLDRLDAMAARLAIAADRQQTVFVATGHPVGLRPTHTAVAVALEQAGCWLLTPARGWRHPDSSPYGGRGQLDYLDKVGVLMGSGGYPRHTHSPLLMRAVLDELASTGQPPPDLVVADHGWAGAAGQAGIDSMGYADCNDPGLFVGEAEGSVLVTVPLDDNVEPSLYSPMTQYLLAHAGLTP